MIRNNDHFELSFAKRVHFNFVLLIQYFITLKIKICVVKMCCDPLRDPPLSPICSLLT